MAKKPTSTNPLILALIILLGVVAGYVYYSQAISEEAFDVPLPAGAQDSSFLKFKDLKFDFALLQNQVFSSLRTFGEFPVAPGFTGKKDLFSP